MAKSWSGIGHPGLVEDRAAASLAEVAEQAHHALVGFAPAGQRPVDDLLEDQAQPLAGMAQGCRTPPALMSDSTVRLLRTMGSTRAQKS